MTLEPFIEPKSRLHFITTMGRERSVSFGALVIDEFELGVGDNPAVSGGVPVALSTTHLRRFELDVDRFEKQKHKKSPKSHLVMDRDTRRNLSVLARSTLFGSLSILFEDMP